MKQKAMLISIVNPNLDELGDVIVASENQVNFIHFLGQPDVIGRPHVSQSDDNITSLDFFQVASH